MRGLNRGRPFDRQEFENAVKEIQATVNPDFRVRIWDSGNMPCRPEDYSQDDRFNVYVKNGKIIELSWH